MSDLRSPFGSEMLWSGSAHAVTTNYSLEYEYDCPSIAVISGAAIPPPGFAPIPDTSLCWAELPPGRHVIDVTVDSVTDLEWAFIRTVTPAVTSADADLHGDIRNINDQ